MFRCHLKGGHTLIQVLIPPILVLTDCCVFRHSLFSFRFFCALLMAPCTRRSCVLGASGHTQGQMSENPGLLRVPTTTSVLDQSQHQNGIDAAQHNINPPGKSDISLSYAPL